MIYFLRTPSNIVCLVWLLPTYPFKSCLPSLTFVKLDVWLRLQPYSPCRSVTHLIVLQIMCRDGSSTRSFSEERMGSWGMCVLTWMYISQEPRLKGQIYFVSVSSSIYRGTSSLIDWVLTLSKLPYSLNLKRCLLTPPFRLPITIFNFLWI